MEVIKHLKRSNREAVCTGSEIHNISRGDGNLRMAGKPELIVILSGSGNPGT